MELMGLWTPIVSSAKSTYWEDSTGGRSVLLAMRRISYEIITRFIGAMKSWNEAETELTCKWSFSGMKNGLVNIISS